MAKTLLGAAANKAHLEMTDNPGDAELAIKGDKVLADSALNGKVWLGDINRAVAHPETVPERSERPRVSLQRTGCGQHWLLPRPKRIVAVTACLTGVAHTFMAAEGLKPKRKTRLVGKS